MPPIESAEPAASEEAKPARDKTFFDRKLSDRPERFEDFAPWQEARRLSNRLYEVTDKPEFAADIAVRDEIRRAAVEVMTHIASGVEGYGDREFVRGLSQAKQAAAAIRSLLFVAVDRNYLSEQEQTELAGRASSLSRTIGTQLFRLKRAETTDDKRRGGFGKKPGFAGKKPGGFRDKGPGGGGGPGGKKPYGKPGGGFGGKKPFKPKRDE